MIVDFEKSLIRKVVWTTFLVVFGEILKPKDYKIFTNGFMFFFLLSETFSCKYWILNDYKKKEKKKNSFEFPVAADLNDCRLILYSLSLVLLLNIQ